MKIMLKIVSDCILFYDSYLLFMSNQFKHILFKTTFHIHTQNIITKVKQDWYVHLLFSKTEGQ